MSTYTLEEYEAKLKTHGPQPSDKSIQKSVDCLREYLKIAKETGEKQEFIDCRTCEPGIICYPDGKIEWAESEAKKPKPLPKPLPLREVRRGFPGVELAFFAALISAAVIVALYALIRIY